jgi:hypothetical protein
LDACHFGLEPWHFDGARHFAHCHFGKQAAGQRHRRFEKKKKKSKKSFYSPSSCCVQGLVMQLLAGSKIIEVDRNSKVDTALYKGAEKLFGVVSVERECCCSWCLPC